MLEIFYHGSNEKDLKSIKSTGTYFDGLFCSADIEVAQSHGEFVYEVACRGPVLKTRMLDYGLDYEVVKKALDDTLSEDGCTFFNDDDEESIWEAVVSDTLPYGHTLFSDNLADSSWHAQALRGKLAKRLGYNVVEMNDEHGTSYLVVKAESMKLL